MGRHHCEGSRPNERFLWTRSTPIRVLTRRIPAVRWSCVSARTTRTCRPSGRWRETWPPGRTSTWTRAPTCESPLTRRVPRCSTPPALTALGCAGSVSVTARCASRRLWRPRQQRLPARERRVSAQSNRQHSDDYAHLQPLLDEFAMLDPADPRRDTLREQLVTGYLPLAEHVAQRFSGRGVAKEDLVQVARLGLVNAVDR